MWKNEVIYKIKAVILISIIISCNAIQTSISISKNLSTRKKFEKNKKSSKLKDKFYSDSNKLSLSTNISKKVELRKKAETKFIFFLVLGIIVFTAFTVKTVSITIDHTYLYPAQKENLSKLEELERNYYLLKTEKCSISKITAYQNKSILFISKLRFIPFNYGSIKIDDCLCKLEDEKYKYSNEKCQQICPNIKKMVGSLKNLLTKNEELTNEYIKTADINCGWKRDHEKNISDLKSSYQKIVSYQTSLWEDISQDVKIVSDCIVNLLALQDIKRFAESTKDTIDNLYSVGVDLNTALQETYDLIENYKNLNVIDLNTLDTITLICDMVNKIYSHVKIVTAFWPVMRNVIDFFDTIISAIKNVTQFLSKKDFSPYNVLFHVSVFVENIKDLVSFILGEIKANKVNAMFCAVCDLIISSLRLARSLVGLSVVEDDKKKIDKYELMSSDEGKKATKKMCEDERKSVSTAIKTQDNIILLNNLEYIEDNNKHKELIEDFNKLCLYNLNLCTRNSKNENLKFLSSDTFDFKNLTNHGPISDIIVDSGFNDGFSKFELKEITIEGTSNVWKKKIYICRACSSVIITSISLIDKNYALNDYSNKKIIHLSYNQSLLIDYIDSAINSGKNIDYVENFKLKLKDKDEEPIFELGPIDNNYTISYSNSKYNIEKKNSPPNNTIKYKAGPIRSDLYDNELNSILKDFCDDNCIKDTTNNKYIADTKNKCLNFYKKHKYNHRFLEITRNKKELEIIAKLKEEYNQICTHCPNDSLSKTNCVIFYEKEKYQGKTYTYCDNQSDVINFNFNSVKIDDRYLVRAYSEKNFKTTLISFMGDLEDIHKYNDQIKSFKICLKLDIGCTEGFPLPGCATFYEHSDYEGRSWNICDDKKQLDNDQNLKFSSVKIYNGYQVIIFNQPEFRGDAHILKKDIPNFRNIGYTILKEYGKTDGDYNNDSTQSVKVCEISNIGCLKSSDLPKPGCVYFFTYFNFQGERYEFCNKINENNEIYFRSAITDLNTIAIIKDNGYFSEYYNCINNRIPNLLYVNDRLRGFDEIRLVKLADLSPSELKKYKESLNDNIIYNSIT